jgi:hypothetical protein
MFLYNGYQRVLAGFFDELEAIYGSKHHISGRQALTCLICLIATFILADLCVLALIGSGSDDKSASVSGGAIVGILIIFAALANFAWLAVTLAAIVVRHLASSVAAAVRRSS